jgi:hypothetical protein
MTKEVHRRLALASVVVSAAVAQQPTIAETRLQIEGASTADEWGGSVGRVGDVDGDGADDLIVAAPFDDTYGPDLGLAKLVSGRTGATLWTLPGVAGKRPATVSGGGDVDGDGVGDFMVGLPQNGSSPLGPGGSARVYSGATGALLWTFAGSTLNDSFGFSNAIIGDVNGDGHADCVAGTILPWNSSQAGYVRCYSGATGAQLWQRNGSYAGHLLGFSMAAAGDVDGDGIPDVIVGAMGDHTFGTQNGAAYVYHGATGATLRTFVGAAGGHRFGFSVDGLGDLNADGKAEVIVGVFRGNGPGYAHVYDGQTGTILYAPTHAIIADRYGHTVASAGDFDADGTPDFVVAAPDGDVAGIVDCGFCRVFSGATGALLREFHGDVATRKFPYAVGRAGDVNGDGLDDFFAGTISVATLPGRLQVLSRLAAAPYGFASAGDMQLPLTWAPGPLGDRAAGALATAGAPPFASGLLGISAAPLAPLEILGVDVVIDVLSGGWIGLPISFDATGGFALPIDLRTPGLAGIPLYLQVVVADPAAPQGLRGTNGMLTLFGA